MSEIHYEKLLPPLLSGRELIDRIGCYPHYDEQIRDNDQNVRLEALTDIYRLYYPFPITVEIYNKLYLATSLSLKKKNTKLAIRQRNETYKAMIGNKEYHGIIGGADSLTVIGKSGTGKTSAIMTAINMISCQKVIETENPYSRIIPALKVECPFDASSKGLLLEIMRSVDEVLGTNYFESSRKTSDTTDILIGAVSQIALNHIGLLVIDEIQNVWGRKNGILLMSMIIQIINSSGISIALVGTEECIPFFEKAAQLARRAQGIKFSTLSFDDTFDAFCTTVWQYQYVKEYTSINEEIVEWLYEHSAGIVSNIVSLIHDAQEIAILDGYEKLNIESLENAYKRRMSMMQRFIESPKRKKTVKHDSRKDVFEEQDACISESIVDMVKTAKNRGLNPVDFLMEHIVIEEVAVE